MCSLSKKHSMITSENWDQFTEEDHKTWQILFKRQSEILIGRALDDVINGIHKLNICNDKIPKFTELNKILKKETGFSIVPVSGLIPDDLFFQLLSERKFPSTCFIRKPHQLDYLEEPDIFHDTFGHIPLLVNPIYADFMEKFGLKSLEAMNLGMTKYAATLYWFTVEFGLIKNQDKLEIYGAGIISSKSESIYCLESDIPLRVKFDLHRLLKTKYHTDSFQKTYFVIEDFKQLFDSVDNLDWKEILELKIKLEEIEQGVYLNKEELL